MSAPAAGESNEDLVLSAVTTNPDRLSTSTGNSLSNSITKKEEFGHHDFMGSICRMSLVSSHKRHKREKSAEPCDGGNVHSPSMSNAIPSLPIIPIDLYPLSAPLLSPQGSFRHQASGQMTLSEIAAPNTSKLRLAPAIPVSFSTPVDLSSATTCFFPHKRERACAPSLAHFKSSLVTTTEDGSPQECGSPISRITTSTQATSLGRASPLPMGTRSGRSPRSDAYRRDSLGDLKIPM